MAGLLKKFFLVFLGDFLLGIFVGEMFMAGEFFRIFLVLILTVFFLWKILLKDVFEVRKFLCAFLLIFVCGIFRFFWSFALLEDDVRRFSGEATLRGCIKDEVDVREDKVKYVLEMREIMIWKSHDVLSELRNFQKVSGKVLVNAPRYPVFGYGDCLQVSGNLEEPGIIESESGFRDFDYGKYLARYDIYRVIFRAEVSKWVDGEADYDLKSGFFYYLYKAKGDFSLRISRIFGEPYGGLLQGLLLGSRRGIDDVLMEKFNITGLTHIIAISGWNITMVILVMGFLLKFLSRRAKVLASFAGVVLFVLFVGASASVVRAAVMGVISLMAVMFGRAYFVEIALVLAAFLMNLWNPKVLVYDVGFQLSVLATMGLVYFGGILKAFIGRSGSFLAKILPERFAIRESFSMSLAAQICALPIILLNFGRLSIVSLVANIFVLPLIPLAMLFGFLAVLASYVADFLGIFIGFFAYILLWIVIFLVKFFAAVPFASLDVGWMNFYLAVLWYFLLILWIRKAAT
ncbi:ComEC/Rec2 family competence protein [Candidatus Peregrinibacteria bacterium]|nr:ComEC/Rec2 family competence protein [Candidatus Peregrinibacteria bacterium]